MPCSFRLVEQPLTTAVTLRLFRLDEATMGEITGPLRLPGSGKLNERVDRCIAPASEAIALAIRIANASDCEVVVVGDGSLWNSAWGELIPSTPSAATPMEAATTSY